MKNENYSLRMQIVNILDSISISQIVIGPTHHHSQTLDFVGTDVKNISFHQKSKIKIRGKITVCP